MIDQITGKVSLIDEYEAYTDEGSDLSKKFEDLIKYFVEEYCTIYNSTQVEYILGNTLDSICAEERLKNSMMKIKCAEERLKNSMMKIKMERNGN